jgi:Cu(I)/Ag(I) efflux system periplasmic protein CusF
MKIQRIKRVLSFVAALATSGQVLAQPPLPMADGEVRRIDAANGKITLKHGEIKNLDMPGMTMVFRIKDPVMLEKLVVGDKIKFTVEQKPEGFTVMQLEKSAP